MNEYSVLAFIGIGTLAAIGYSVIVLVWPYELTETTLGSIEQGQRDEGESRRTVVSKLLILTVAIIALLSLTTFVLARHIVNAQASPSGGVPMASAPAPLLSLLVGGGYFVAMVLGMVGEYMFGLKSWRKFRWFEFQRPLWVSLIVFAVIWSALDHGQLTVTSLMACYQNGFFWKLILKQEEKQMARRGAIEPRHRKQ